MEWLGRTPTDWQLEPLWTMYRRAKRTDYAEEELLSVYRDYGVIPTASRTDNFNRPSEDLSTYQLVERRDLVTNKMKTWQGSIAVSNHRGIVSPAYHVYVPLHSENDRYLHYLLRSSAYVSLYMQLSKGIRVSQWDLEAEAFSRIVVLLPSRAEQTAIADFLDRETAEIDALVAKKERLIELLQEKRTALITRAVTKGLDPNVPMKDSGVEWLGEIPVHWEIRRLKTIVRVELSNVDKKAIEGQEAVQLCNYVDVYYNEHITADIEFMKATATKEQTRRFSLKAGDVLITKDSESWTDIAVPAVVTEDLPGVLCGYHLALIRPLRNCHGRFLSRAFAAVGPRDQFQIVADGITRFGLSGDSIRSGVFAVPPQREQEMVASFLDRETDKIDALVAKIRQAIDLLKEYRTALISAAVTGKIDVREEVA